jgi:hypothetical protein
VRASRERESRHSKAEQECLVQERNPTRRGRGRTRESRRPVPSAREQALAEALAEEKQALAEEKQAHAKTRAHAAVYITFCIALVLCLGQHAKTRAHAAVYIIHILYCLAFWVNLCALLLGKRGLKLKEISTLVAIPRHLHLVLASRKL